MTPFEIEVALPNTCSCHEIFLFIYLCQVKEEKLNHCGWLTWLKNAFFICVKTSLFICDKTMAWKPARVCLYNMCTTLPTVDGQDKLNMNSGFTVGMAPIFTLSKRLQRIKPYLVCTSVFSKWLKLVLTKRKKMELLKTFSNLQ